MSPHGPEHDGPLSRLMELLVAPLAGRARVRIQSSFAASDGSEPEPDVALVPLADYDDAHPEEAFLIIEVAKSSLAKDKGPKARLYAQSAVEEYWVVNLVEDLIEVYSEPRDGLYTHITLHRRGDVVTLRRFPDVAIGVSDVLRAKA
jgi:Uma2 family endonuclease